MAEHPPKSKEELVASLKAKFPMEILEGVERKGMLAVVRLKSESLLSVATYLKDECTFSHCALAFGIDWVNHFEVVYDLWSDDLSGYVELSVEVPPEDPHVDSLSNLWYGANWHERETWDLVGVKFDGHPNLKRVLMPEAYKFHPLRKSFELHEPEELEVKVRHD